MCFDSVGETDLECLDKIEGYAGLGNLGDYLSQTPGYPAERLSDFFLKRARIPTFEGFFDSII